MPKLLSSRKRLRQAEKARLRNKAAVSTLRSALKKVRSASTRTDAEALLAQAVSTIDKSARKGMIHKNAAARYKSSIARRINAMQA